MYASGLLTLGRYTEELEARAAAILGVRHAVAVSSCTSGLILLLRALDLRGEVILPSFTWASTGHAALWNNLRPVFADCEEHTYTVKAAEVEALIGPETAAVIAVNTFGLYPDMDALAALCRARGLRFVSDSAQGSGARYQGRIGGGLADAEVFSLSPTKVVTAVEGGLVTTNDAGLAGIVRRMRDYGKSANGRDVEYLGLSARISEFHAVIGLMGFERLDELLQRRAAILRVTEVGWTASTGCVFRNSRKGARHPEIILLLSWNPTSSRGKRSPSASRRWALPPNRIFPTAASPKAFAAEGAPRRPLPVTEWASARGLALPIFTHMDDATVDRVCAAVRQSLS
ncbi:MAG: DegT/DnrJ/EryC1/StrS family aminotransferase [Deltaproteobacteria bacterium]|nr:DegT/DnrJ/EryC1/StrS family aminotransferase [Deltaproteobacteria bacterium]